MKIRRIVLTLFACLVVSVAHNASACTVRGAEARVGDGTMPYITAGDDSKPGVLLVHGLFAQKEQWRDVLCKLADAGYQPIAPDLPGYGQSQGYDLSVYRLESQVQLLAQFVRQIGIQPTHIAGNSMGGAIAALYARSNAGQVKTLAFIGGTLGIGPWANTVKDYIFAGQNPFIPISPTALDAELSMLLVNAPKLAPETQAAVLAPYQQNTNHYIQVWNIVNLYDTVIADMPANRLPTLILWGKEDRVFDIANGSKLAAKYPRHHRQDLPDAGHLPMVDTPNAVADAYVRFLKRPAH